MPSIDLPLTRGAMVTHVPFWRRTDGAQQRMWSLYQFLRSRGVQVSILYLGSPTVAFDQEPGQEQQLDLDVRALDQPTAKPRLSERLKNAWESIFQARQTEDGASTGLTIDAFFWEQASRELERQINDLAPELVIVEYIALAKYAKSLRPKLSTETKIILDSHDVMHLRCSRFQEQGKEHWLNITREQESQALDCFDMVLAIQSEEAAIFEEMCPATKVVVAGHHPMGAVALGSREREGFSESITIGFLGSANEPNRQGVEWFLAHVWPRFRELEPTQVTLLLAGGFSEDLNVGGDDNGNIIWWPPQNDTRNFYEAVDVVINPVSFGTGLKIKSVEALAWGRPLVTTTHSASGLPPSMLPLVAIADDAGEFAAALHQLVVDEEFRTRVAADLASLGAKEFDGSTVYREFEDWLRTTFSLG